MGMVFGKISVETPKYKVLHSTALYEIRQYAPSVVAQFTYDPSDLKGNKDGGFTVLANYIGALGNPQNTKPEKIAMTAPVITKTQNPESEKIAMTAPVVTREEKGKKMVTMEFLLPAKYEKAEDAPKPVDERVVIREEGERKYGVVGFAGVATEEVVAEKVEKLKESLEKDGYKIIGDYILARYNPPWTLPPFRTNEDRDESEQSLRKCLPVVSFSIGDAAEFLYGEQKDVDKANKVILESGDVLIFGGKSRHVFHGVSSIKPDTAPKTLLEKTNLRSCRLNLTFREY